MSADKVTAGQPIGQTLPSLRLHQELSWQELYKNWQANQKQAVVLVDVAQKRREHKQQWLSHQIQNQLSFSATAKKTVSSVPKTDNNYTSPLNTSQKESVLPLTPSITEDLSNKFIFPRLKHIKHQFLSLNWLQIASNFSLSAAVALFLLFGGPIIILESQSLFTKAMDLIVVPNKTTSNPLEQLISLPTVKPEPKISSAEDVFSISIPTLDIESAVIPNVDPSDANAYTQALKQGVAHAAGTGLPDQLNNNTTIYLFAHSTDAPWNILRYNAEFYALKDINPGEKINLRFWGKDYQYTVSETKIVDAQDVEALKPQQDQEQLILQTCYPPGTTQKRLLVIATPSAQLVD